MRGVAREISVTCEFSKPTLMLTVKKAFGFWLFACWLFAVRSLTGGDHTKCLPLLSNILQKPSYGERANR